MAGEDLTEIHERIRWARRSRTDLARPIDAARALDVKPGTYRTWELDRAEGGRVPSDEHLRKIATRFGVSWVWLLTGVGTPDQKEDEMGEYIKRLMSMIDQVPDTKRADALRAIEGVLGAFGASAA